MKKQPVSPQPFGFVQRMDLAQAEAAVQEAYTDRDTLSLSFDLPTDQPRGTVYVKLPDGRLIATIIPVPERF
jgi:hypothetical protein